MYKRILVPVYGLENFEVSLAPVAEIAQKIDAEVILLYVASFICHFSYDAPVGLKESCRIDEKEYEFAAALLDKVQKELSSEGISISTVIQPTHNPLTGIISFIKNNQVDLVAFANTERHNKRFFQRTLSEKLISAGLNVSILVI